MNITFNCRTAAYFVSSRNYPVGNWVSISSFPEKFQYHLIIHAYFNFVSTTTMYILHMYILQKKVNYSNIFLFVYVKSLHPMKQVLSVVLMCQQSQSWFSLHLNKIILIWAIIQYNPKFQFPNLLLFTNSERTCS